MYYAYSSREIIQARRLANNAAMLNSLRTFFVDSRVSAMYSDDNRHLF